MRELDFVFAEVLNYNESQDLEMLERTPVHEVVDLEDSEDEQETKEAENHDERLVCVCRHMYLKKLFLTCGCCSLIFLSVSIKDDPHNFSLSFSSLSLMYHYFVSFIDFARI